MGCSRSRAFPRIPPQHSGLCSDAAGAELSRELGAQALPQGWIERDGQAQTETRRQHLRLPSLKQLYPCNPKPPRHAAYPLKPPPAAGAGSGSEGASVTGSSSAGRTRQEGAEGAPGRGLRSRPQPGSGVRMENNLRPKCRRAPGPGDSPALHRTAASATHGTPGSIPHPHHVHLVGAPHTHPPGPRGGGSPAHWCHLRDAPAAPAPSAGRPCPRCHTRGTECRSPPAGHGAQ